MAATIAGITMTADCGKLVHQVWVEAKGQIDTGGKEIVVTDGTANAMGQRGVALLASAYENYLGTEVVILHDAEMAMTSIIPVNNLPTVMHDTNAINMSLPSNNDAENKETPSVLSRASLRNHRSRVAKSRHNEPPRPLNAWIIFRSYRSPIIKAENPEMKTCQISQVLSGEWRAMTAGEKAFWKDQASQHLDMHRTMFPNYKFKPSSSAYKHRRQTVRQLAGIDPVNEADKAAKWIEESGLKNPNPGMPFVNNSGVTFNVQSVLYHGNNCSPMNHFAMQQNGAYNNVYSDPSSAAFAIDAGVNANPSPFPLIQTPGANDFNMVSSGDVTDGINYDFDVSSLAVDDAYGHTDLSATLQSDNEV